LQSIDRSLKTLVQLASARAKAVSAAVPHEVATDRDLDGKWGNPLIRFNPRGWKGPTFKDRKMSQCPPEFLDLLAEAHDWFADKADRTNEMTKSDHPKPKAPFERQAAARARGWAKRLREGKVAPPTLFTPPAAPSSRGDSWEGDEVTDEDIPF
jgi:hypothetical protein